MEPVLLVGRFLIVLSDLGDKNLKQHGLEICLYMERFFVVKITFFCFSILKID